jgi:hypothetical protein
VPMRAPQSFEAADAQANVRWPPGAPPGSVTQVGWERPRGRKRDTARVETRHWIERWPLQDRGPDRPLERALWPARPPGRDRRLAAAHLVETARRVSALTIKDRRESARRRLRVGGGSSGSCVSRLNVATAISDNIH